MDTTTQAPETQVAQTSSVPASGLRIDSKTAIAIINKRITVNPTMIGDSIVLTVQGTGQFLPQGHKYTVAGVERTNQFDRTIYNVRASSSLLMTSAEGKKLFKDAMLAESAGDVEKAHELFNSYLNYVQLSFSVINNGRGTERSFNSGDDIKARITQVVSQAGTTSLQLEDVSYVAPKVVRRQTFSVTDLIEA